MIADRSYLAAGGKRMVPFRRLVECCPVMIVRSGGGARVDTGKISAEAFLTSQAKITRDNARTRGNGIVGLMPA
jgi:hypothetical protein